MLGGGRRWATTQATDGRQRRTTGDKIPTAIGVGRRAKKKQQLRVKRNSQARNLLTSQLRYFEIIPSVIVGIAEALQQPRQPCGCD
jgi:hypothetical protein